VDALREGRRAHASRNPMLVRVFTDAEIMRDEGEGIVRVFREMEGGFLHEPQIASESGLFTITLFNEPNWDLHGPGWGHFVAWLRITDDQKRILLLRPHGFTQGDYERLNAVTPEEAAMQIRDLVSRGLVGDLPADEDSPPTFAIPPNKEEVRVFLNDRIPRLRDHLRREPSMKNADYRALFQLDRHRALRELRQLVRLGVLVETGIGRGTRYKGAEPVGEQPL
jgi:ATP-dependent DNA helicase RecG